MANPKKTYFLCPNWDYHPDGPIQLGNIIISPYSPAYSLNAFKLHPLPEGSLFPSTVKTGVTWSTEKLRSGEYGLWTEFLSFISGLGVDVGFDHSLSSEQTYHFDTITTTEFMPTPEYLARSMAAPGVVDFLKKSRFRKHVYMITALKVVQGAKAKVKHDKSIGGKFGFSVDGSLTGAPLSLGPEISAKRSDGQTTSFEGSSDFVFAYRLRKVITNRSGEVSSNDYTKGALFGMPASAELKQTVAQQLPYVVEGLEEEDASAQDFDGLGHFDQVLDGVDSCVCVWPEVDEIL